jgi:hypothetical protein
MAIGRYRLLDSAEAITANTFTTIALNAANNSAGSVFAFEGGHGAITAVMFNATSITTPPTYTVTLQGVTSRATPNGTVYGGGTATGTVIPAVGINTVSLATPYSGTPGDQIQIVINSASAGAGATATIATRVTSAGGSFGLPYAAQQSAGTWAVVTAGAAAIVPIYSDGYVGTGFVCPASMANSTPTSSSNPFYVGNSFTPPDDCVCTGVYLSARVSSGSNFVVSVYSGSTPTLVGAAPTFVVDKMASGVGGVFAHFVPLSAALSMAAGIQYRFLLNMTSATAFNTMVVPTFSTQAIREAYSGLLFATTSPSTVSFTDNQLAVYPLVPKVESVTASAGGGASRSRIFTEGGINDK